MNHAEFPRRTASLALGLAFALALAALTLGSSAHAGEGADLALGHVTARSAALGVSGDDVSDLAVTDEYTSAHNGVTHVHLQQRLDGIAIAGATANVNVKDGAVVNVGSRLRGNARSSTVRSSRAPSAPQDAVRSAAAHLGLTGSSPLFVVAEPAGADRAGTLSGGGVSQRDIPVRLVYQPAGAQLRLAWNVQIDEHGGQHYWDVNVDAETGEVLSQTDLVVHEAAPAGALAAGSLAAAALTAGAAAGGPRAPDSYEVFPLPVESPNHGSSAVVVNPADATASPFGWHDTDGVAGPEFTDTRGNNVFAQEDTDANNTGGGRPSGGAGLDFLSPFDPLADPFANVAASITNLFYWNNIAHDVYYQYGFDEASGNFQVNNYGAGGAGNDQVNADALDGSGTNNANFLTLPDGTPGRMQMFRWLYPFANEVFVNSPAAIAGSYGATGAEFGPALTAGGITRDLVLADDGTGDANDGCEALVNGAQVAGNTAVVDRGTCPFVDKVKNAQTAGAQAVVIVNNVSGSPITMGGTDPTIVVPSVMITLSDGAVIKAELPNVNATVRDASASSPPDRDSDFDSGVIAHEFAHGISTRLTGGPNSVLCLTNEEQMGEGWSDFFGLAVTHQVGDTGPKRRGVGTYLLFEDTDGNGIRPAPYSTDMVENPYTYADRANAEVSVPHGVGFIWASMLWDVYWALIDEYGYNPDVYGDWTTGGNNLAIQLVMDGLKQQPCSPGFVDGRDAILQADQLLTGGANACTIWGAFAARGLGQSASQGSSNNRADGSAAFDLPAACSGAAPVCDVETSSAVYTNGETLTLSSLRFANTTGSTLPARLRLQLSFGALFTLDLIDAGAGGGLNLPDGFDNDFGPLSLFPIPASLPRGDWQFRCAVEDPASGALLTEDVAPFEVQ